MVVVFGYYFGKLQSWRDLPPEPYIDSPETIRRTEA